MVDAAVPEALAASWAEMFGTTIVSREPAPLYGVDLAPLDGVPLIVFQRSDEPKTVQSCFHFDVQVQDIDRAAVQLETLGGHRIDAEIGHEVGDR